MCCLSTGWIVFRMSDSRVPRQLLAPRYWLAWLAAGVWFLLAQLPYRFQWWLARVLAPLLKLNKKRFGYAKRNLELCFPELSEAEREQLLKGNMESTAMALLDRKSTRMNSSHVVMS